MGNMPCCNPSPSPPNPDPFSNPGEIQTTPKPKRPNNPFDRDRLKFLLLGAGESGKSTLFKQMKINYVNGYSTADLLDEKEKIVRAFLLSFKDLIDAIRSQYGIVSDDPDLNESSEMYFPPKNPNKMDTFPKALNPDLIAFLNTVWNSEKGQEIWDNHAAFPITDSLGYFCENLDRISDENYEPTEMDYLKCRVVSAGIVEQTFELRKVLIVVVDVGGQRAERKKWVSCFDGVEAVLFVASLSEFDQMLFEDATVDRLGEAKALWKKTFNFALFNNTQFVLFLNKQDLLKEKIERLEKKNISLDTYFPKLKLGHNYKNAVQIIQEDLRDEFLGLVDSKDRVIAHFVTATDKTIFSRVFNAATNIVLKNAAVSHVG